MGADARRTKPDTPARVMWSYLLIACALLCCPPSQHDALPAALSHPVRAVASGAPQEVAFAASTSLRNGRSLGPTARPAGRQVRDGAAGHGGRSCHFDAAHS